MVSGQLYSLDSTFMDPHAKLFDWAKYRTTKGAITVRFFLDHDGLLPEYGVLTEGKVTDIKEARKLQFS